MSPSIQSAMLLFLALASAAPAPTTPNPLIPRALNPSCAPGGNFDLSNWTLQLPTGSAGKVDSVSASKLKGCNGWTNDKYFFTAKDSGALVMKVPGSSTSSGCVTTPNSKHCRTELRESSPQSWDSKTATNRLKASLTVKVADDSKYGTVIGQVKVDDKVSKKPLTELFINKSGTITAGVSQIPDVSSLKMTEIGKVKIGEKFSYELRYEKGVLSVVINDDAAKTLGTGSIKSPPCYFKAGNYNQGNSPSEVEFYSIDIQH
ncbi:alginate lyase 2 [Byssothecium circinans]|uniref:Alginate lyase 2 n=1 Tax=Byssothecium circinans TaxID=147558 RepID=A0A6A5TAY4_9PLEO|nr:alginate lyase 2 [Byssothecium circinans]